DQQYRAEGDGTVSEVERREVRVAPVEIEEVDDMAMNDAIVQVAKRTANHQRQRTGYQRLALEAQQPHQHDDHRDNRHHRKEVTLPTAGIGQKTERRARVVGQRQVEERQYRNELAILDR